jgi:hypothetical protein
MTLATGCDTPVAGGVGVADYLPLIRTIGSDLQPTV